MGNWGLAVAVSNNNTKEKDPQEDKHASPKDGSGNNESSAPASSPPEKINNANVAVSCQRQRQQSMFTDHQGVINLEHTLKLIRGVGSRSQFGAITLAPDYKSTCDIVLRQVYPANNDDDTTANTTR